MGYIHLNDILQIFKSKEYCVCVCGGGGGGACVCGYACYVIFLLATPYYPRCDNLIYQPFNQEYQTHFITIFLTSVVQKWVTHFYYLPSTCRKRIIMM